MPTDRDNLAREVAERLSVNEGAQPLTDPDHAISRIWNALLDSEEKCRKLQEALEAFMDMVLVGKSDMQAEKNAILHAHNLGRAALSGKG